MSDQDQVLGNDNTNPPVDDGTGDGAGTPEPKWFESLADETLKSNETLTAFESVEDLSKDYLDKLGKVREAPETPDAYEFQLPEDANPELVNSFKTWAHEQGLSNDQAAGLVNQWQGFVEKQQESMQQAEADGIESLKKEWGNHFNENVQTANTAIQKVCEKAGVEYDAVKQALAETRAGNRPEMVKLFAGLGMALSEDFFESSQDGSTKMREQKKEQERIQHGYAIFDYPSMQQQA